MSIFLRIKSNRWYGQFVSFSKFSMVGLLNTGIDFISFAILYSALDLHYLPSQAIAYTAGVLNSFVCNKLWTFQNRSHQVFRQMTKFVIINAISLLISLMGLKIFCDFLGLNVYMVKIFIIAITQLINYCGYRFWVFLKSQV